MLVLWLLALALVQHPAAWAARYQDALSPAPSGVVNDVYPVERLFTKKHWAVDPKKDLLSVILPIFPSDLELGYLFNQLRTFDHYFKDAHELNEFLLVTPASEADNLATFMDSTVKPTLRNIPPDLFRLVTDADCAQDLAKGTRYDRDDEVFPGWIKQQVVKLACASHVRTPFYLVLDSDIFYTNPVSVRDLFQDSECTPHSVICDDEKLVSFQAKNDMYPLMNRSTHQTAWTQNSARLMQLDVPIDWRIAMGVTPQILAVDVALSLADFIQQRFRQPSWQAFLLESLTWHQIDYKATGVDWTPPWTEYTLYWVFATHACVLDNYHSIAEVLQQNAVWGLDDFKAWNACQDTFNNGNGYFSLAQSRWQLDPKLIWERIKPCLR